MPKKNRIKITAPTIATRSELEDVIGSIRAITIQRNQLAAEREACIKVIDDEAGPLLGECDKQLQQLTEQVKVWAEANPAEFDGKRSLETIHGKLGWRTGQWQIAALPGWIWQRGAKSAKNAKAVLDSLKKRFGAIYVRTKEEVDKDAIIAARASISAEAMADVGVRVFQEESFYVEPNVEETDNRQTAAA